MLKVCGYTFMFFPQFYKGRQILWLPVFFPGQHSPIQNGVYTERKDFAPRE